MVTNLEQLKKSNSNSLMVLSFLFVGTLFFFFIFLVELYVENGLIHKARSIMPKRISLSGIEKIWGAGLVIAFIYGVGFVLYCLSLPLISGPIYIILKALNYKSYASIAIESEMESKKHHKELISNISTNYMIGFLYLRLRILHPLISDELKFLFNQLMFARSCLGALVVAVGLQLWVSMESIRLFSMESIRLLLYALLVYAPVLLIYCSSIKFWDKTLFNAYVINVFELNDKLRRKEVKYRARKKR